MDLQSSLQVTSSLGEFDFHLLLVLLVMVIAGVLGGLANHYLAERLGATAHGEWRRYLVFGVVTALTAPLLLNMLSSNLLEGARSRPGELYVFAAFCLIYVMAARRMFENPAARYNQQMEQLRKEIELLREQVEREQRHFRGRLEALQVVSPAADLQPEKSEPKAEVKEVVTYNDVEILRALADESYVYGNLAALTEKTTLGRELISQRLTVLKNIGLIDTRINDKNVLHWVISSRGRQILGEILSGQSDTQKVA